jgi:hypothetical protein
MGEKGELNDYIDVWIGKSSALAIRNLFNQFPWLDQYEF